MISFIRPSRRGWYVAINAVIWYLVARVNHNLIALILAWGSLALLAVSFLAAFLSLRKVRIARGNSTDAQVGKLLNLPFRCQNLKRRKRQPFVILEQMPFAHETALATPCPAMRGRTEVMVNRTVMPVKRGEFKLQDVIIRDSDPAGLFLREKLLKLPNPVVVYPHVLPIRQLYLPPQETFNATAATSPIAAAGNSQDFYGVREYHPTDGMKYIHWKSSAKHHKFMVREFERATSLSALILLDANQNSLTPKTAANLETAITLAASVGKYLAPIYCTIAFAAGGETIHAMPPRDAHLAIPTIMYELATLKPGNFTLEQALDAVANALPDNTVVFCFSLSQDQQTRDTINILMQKGLDVRWFLMEPEDFKPRARKNKRQETNADSLDLTPTKVTPDMSADDIFPA